MLSTYDEQRIHKHILKLVTVLPTGCIVACQQKIKRKCLICTTIDRVVILSTINKENKKRIMIVVLYACWKYAQVRRRNDR